MSDIDISVFTDTKMHDLHNMSSIECLVLKFNKDIDDNFNVASTNSIKFILDLWGISVMDNRLPLKYNDIKLPSWL